MGLDGEEEEGLNEWEQIQPPWHQSSTSALDAGGGATTAPAIVMRDDYIPNNCFVFPPTKHEGLPLPLPQQPSKDSSSPSPTSSEEGDEVAPVVHAVEGRWRARLGVLCSGVVRIAYGARNYPSFGRGFWSLVWVTGALVASVFYVKVRRWRRRFMGVNENRLMVVIREKDQKIGQLLQQIAEMNELLVNRRRVSVVRVG